MGKDKKSKKSEKKDKIIKKDETTSSTDGDGKAFFLKR